MPYQQKTWKGYFDSLLILFGHMKRSTINKMLKGSTFVHHVFMAFCILHPRLFNLALMHTGLSGQWSALLETLAKRLSKPSSPYKNLSQRGALRAELNSLRVMFPVLDDPKKGLPLGALDIGDGFQLRRAMDSYQREILGQDREAILQFLLQHGVEATLVRLRKWARLRLPNGQIARSAWKEVLKPLEKLRMARNVKVCHTFSL